MLQKTEILNIIIGVALMTGSYAIWKDTRICLSIALGSAIGGANFWALYNIIKGLVGDAVGKMKFAFFAFFKFFILIFVLWASIKWLPLNAVAFLLGLSTVVVAMLLASLQS
ncbi:MAG: ATP synthase subunit I [Deltaproteobacteria bacterium]|nr:ATP synthase subunit I [Deltaproteobacteria bacterium]